MNTTDRAFEIHIDRRTLLRSLLLATGGIITNSHYAEFQDRIEHYWCLRWLLQENISETRATVIRDNLVRFEQLPLTVRLADLPSLPAEAAVRVGIGRVDLLAATIECRYAGPAD